MINSIKALWITFLLVVIGILAIVATPVFLILGGIGVLFMVIKVSYDENTNKNEDDLE